MIISKVKLFIILGACIINKSNPQTFSVSFGIYLVNSTTGFAK